MAEAVEAVTENAGPARDLLWNDWDTPPRIPDVPMLHLDGFDGPMDLLLDLAERQRIDFGRISVVQLAEQFLTAMERYAQHVDIERRADWLVIAARLVLLRSRLLFPVSPQAQADAAREASREVERLQEIAFIRAAAAWLDQRPQLGRDMFTRPQKRSPRVASYMALMEACLTVLRGREEQPAADEPVYQTIMVVLFRVPEALARMRAQLIELAEPAPLETFLPIMPEQVANRELVARSAVSSTFVAALELSRLGEAGIGQDEAFGPILVDQTSFVSGDIYKADACA